MSNRDIQAEVDKQSVKRRHPARSAIHRGKESSLTRSRDIYFNIIQEEQGTPAPSLQELMRIAVQIRYELIGEVHRHTVSSALHDLAHQVFRCHTPRPHDETFSV